MVTELKTYRAVQAIAKSVLDEIKIFIKPSLTESDIAMQCLYLMQQHEVNDFWYHNVPALVLVGERTTLSISGKDYSPTLQCVKEMDLITIDLSPEKARCWGDCARSYAIVDGRVYTQDVPNEDLSEGFKLEVELHRELARFATKDTTFGQVYSHFNLIIKSHGYVNLDFKNNLGHTIEKDIEERSYIEDGCKLRLNEVNLFTFEPHIAKKNGEWGFKLEDIYYIKENNIRKL